MVLPLEVIQAVRTALHPVEPPAVLTVLLPEVLQAAPTVPPPVPTALLPEVPQAAPMVLPQVPTVLLPEVAQAVPTVLLAVREFGITCTNGEPD